MSIPSFGLEQFDRKRLDATEKRRLETQKATLEKQLTDTRAVFEAVKIHFIQELQSRHDDSAEVASARHFEMAQNLTEILHSAPCEDSSLYKSVKDVCEELESSSNRWQRLFEDQQLKSNLAADQATTLHYAAAAAHPADAFDDRRRLDDIAEEVQHTQYQRYDEHYHDESQEISLTAVFESDAQDFVGDHGGWGDQFNEEGDFDDFEFGEQNNSESEFRQQRRRQAEILESMMNAGADDDINICYDFNTRKGCCNDAADQKCTYNHRYLVRSKTVSVKDCNGQKQEKKMMGIVDRYIWDTNLTLSKIMDDGYPWKRGAMAKRPARDAKQPQRRHSLQW